MEKREPTQWQAAYDAEGRRKYINAAERRRFVDALGDIDASDRALFLVLVVCGVRISEALNLRRQHHFDEEACSLTFRTLKRRRVVYRTLFIPSALASLLASLPTSEDGRWWTMHRTTAWRRIRRVALSAGIDPARCMPKAFRHGFAMHGASKGVPGPVLQSFLGHASIETTTIYLSAVGAEERSFAAMLWDDLPGFPPALGRPGAKRA